MDERLGASTGTIESNSNKNMENYKYVTTQPDNLQYIQYYNTTGTLVRVNDGKKASFEYTGLKNSYYGTRQISKAV